MAAVVNIDTVALTRFVRIFDGALPPVFPRMLESWAVIYRSAMQRRFSVYSRGGGNWAPLAKSTLARRRKPKRRAKGKRKSGRAASILFDTGGLFASLSPSLSIGGRQESSGHQIAIGFAPISRQGSRANLAEIAGFHQFGAPARSLPRREILVLPDDKTKAQMARVAERWMAAVWRDVSG